MGNYEAAVRRLGLVVVVVLLAAGGAVLALAIYGAGRYDTIARGVHVAGVDVGGLGVPAAERRVHLRLWPRLDRPLVLAYGKRRFRITPRQAGLRIAIAPAVREALARSVRGNLLARAWRDLRGRRLRTNLVVHTSYEGTRIEEFVTRVAKELARRPRSARVDATATSIRLFPGHAGRAVLRGELEGAIASHLLADGARVVAVPTRPLAPRVTTASLRRRFGTFIGVSRGEFRLRLFKNFRLVKTYVVSIGQIGYETAAGLYRIRSKVINPNWIVPNEPWAGSLAGRVIAGGSPENPIKARWMGFHGGAGIHGTDAVWSLGHAASHGCVRMSIPDVEDLFERVPLGTPIYIG